MATDRTPGERGDSSSRRRDDYGDHMIGMWVCPAQDYSCYPRELEMTRAKQPFLCPRCGRLLEYDEAE